ncbi:MAG: cytochrome c oxidase subunit 4 [Granulosicoccus sp.]|jgi:cytochrome c oxidase subunit 4
MLRDDIYEYSLDSHHSDEAGKKMRKKFYFVLALLSIITIIEVAMGMKWSRDESMKMILMVSFIGMTLVKAGYIVWVFMHLGDEKKSLQSTVLWTYFILIGYFIFVALVEAVFVGEWRPTVETFIGL